MTVFVALMHAVNLGGTNKLPMAELRAMCGRAGFTRVSTYIASGNLVFEADLTEAKVLARNPFPDAAPSWTPKCAEA